MNLLVMAARNTGRNARRSLLAGLSVFLSILMIIVLHGFTGGFMESLVKNYTKNETGHVHIATAGYRARERFSPVDEYIPDSDALAARVREAMPGRELRIAQRIRFGVLLANGDNSRQALAIAGDPAEEKAFLMLDTRILPGGEYCSVPGTAIVGEKLAKALGLAPGGALRVVTSRADGGLGFRKLRVSGIFRTGVNSMDEAMFQMRLDDARELLGIEGGAQQLLVMLPDSGDAQAAAARLRALGAAPGAPELSILPWTSIGEYPKLIALMDSMYIWMWLFVALLGAFIIANIMTMVVLERRREIGILMSMGMGRNRILGLLVAEGAMLGFAGSLAGAVAGFAFNSWASRAGFDMSAALAGFTWPVDNVIHPSASPGMSAAFVGLGTATAAIMSYLPARKGARMEPVAAIRAA